MSKIRILPDILSNKIAAGEVVERPASVVKELVENSLDAGSTSIEVAIEKGGLAGIRVSDNGHGMGSDDALLSLERYATSKLLSDADLFSIRTLGFRGEALPSMASVSRFELVSRVQDAPAGVRIVVEGGRILDVAETGAAPGTVISVKNLFFNVPARRKFLKTENTEMGHIADTLLSVSLGFPDVQFRLLHNGRVLRHLAGGDAFVRAVDVLGKEVENHLFPVDHGGAGIRVRGWVASPDISRSTTQRIYLYVNGRYVRDRSVYKALFEGYKGRMMTGRYPVAILFLDVDPDRVDVNVHPTKHEVRFADGRAVWAAVRDGVALALRGEDSRKWQVSSVSRRESLEKVRNIVATHGAVSSRHGQGLGPFSGENVSGNVFPTEGPGEAEGLSVSGDDIKDGAGSVSSFSAEAEPLSGEVVGEPAASGDPGHAFSPEAMVSGNGEQRGWAGEIRQERPLFSGQGDRSGVFPVPDPQGILWEKKAFYSELKIIGQLHNTYILCESEAGLVLVDQHAAHERVRYEALRRRHEKGKGLSQQLLIPQVVELGFRETDLARGLMPLMEALGLYVEPFGGNSFVIKAVPDLLSHGDLGQVFADMVAEIVAAGHTESLAEALDECLILMACHSAIRANQALKPEEIRHLFHELDACAQPSRCPHGRPIWIQWEKRFLEKSFGRVG
ncbi:DNA mismatch repair protein MutL [Desulfobotulus alkaliphilus]|uniref:DNA mismatch repair protein MutL n=1 Tax=Desulfobotulus alkaliphilus TaxID=622671 RepID=A0A562RHH1_9BACT|nr:DNA mismatch repair endonuclease MutL [Desulfobotulus alkaliphilus]TWI68501.1 DNA mismatch repair protein MutL [Desulfobotulus alkaliphilus]